MQLWGQPLANKHWCTKDLVARVVGELVPRGLVSWVYRTTTSGLCFAVCLHRVSESRRLSDPYPQMTAMPHDIDTFLHIVSEAGAGVTLCFDDNYADAGRYVATRAPLYPHVKWLLFICPEKVQKQAGFRWDLYEAKKRAGLPLGDLGTFLRQSTRLEGENDDSELQQVGRRVEFEMLREEECQRLRCLGVELGNHTDIHQEPSYLRPEEFEREVHRSTQHFEASFGRAEHFAFPFGLPGLHFDASHVATVSRVAHAPVMWSTEDGLYEASAKAPGAVLPRIIFRGLWGGKAMALWVSWCAVRQHLRRVKLLDLVLQHVTIPPRTAKDTISPAA